MLGYGSVRWSTIQRVPAFEKPLFKNESEAASYTMRPFLF